MILDTSAIAAILFGEGDRDLFIDAIEADPIRLISSVNALESAIVIEARKREQGGRELDLMLHRAKISVVPFTAEHMEEARIAWRIYGKGNHPAGLNFCDCCAYALSKLSGDTLLFKGNDFTQTDVAQAIQQRPTKFSGGDEDRSWKDLPSAGILQRSDRIRPSHRSGRGSN